MVVIGVCVEEGARGLHMLAVLGPLGVTLLVS